MTIPNVGHCVYAEYMFNSRSLSPARVACATVLASSLALAGCSQESADTELDEPTLGAATTEAAADDSAASTSATGGKATTTEAAASEDTTTSETETANADGGMRNSQDFLIDDEAVPAYFFEFGNGNTCGWLDAMDFLECAIGGDGEEPQTIGWVPDEFVADNTAGGLADDTNPETLNPGESVVFGPYTFTYDSAGTLHGERMGRTFTVSPENVVTTTG